MAINSTTNRVSIVGDGSTTAISFPYPLQSSADLTVVKVTIATEAETAQTLNTHYTFSGTAVNGVYPNGGTVTMVSAPSSSYRIVVYRSPERTQGLNLVENDAMPAESLEQALDKRALIELRLNEMASRSLRLAEGVTATIDMTVPALAASNPGATLVLDADGDGWEWGPTADDITSSTTAAAASATAAAASASAASTSASSASSSATAAASSASAASTSATAAAASATAAAASAATAASSGGYNTNSSKASPQSVTAGGNITFTAGYRNNKVYIDGSPGAVSAGNIQAGTVDGDMILIVGGANSVTFDTTGRISMRGTLVLGDGEQLLLNWDHGSTLWREV